MRGFTSWLKKCRVALAAVGVVSGLAGMTFATGAANAADWNDHRGGHERHYDRDDHWRGDWHRDGWRDRYYWHRDHWVPPYRTYVPGYYYAPEAYYPPGYYAEPGVSMGFTFR